MHTNGRVRAPRSTGAGGRVPFGRGTPDMVWPAATGPAIEPIRNQRVAEPLESLEDRFPAESVLLDLAPDNEATDAFVIVARFAALRVALLAAAGAIEGGQLEAEKNAAAAYAGTVPGSSAEARLLREITSMAGAGRGPTARAMPGLLVSAAGAAERRGHAHGAFALLHAAWSMGKATGAWADAAEAAHSISRLAEARGARRSARLWSRRARSLERRSRSAAQ
ncbi:MAG: hypothetical protein L0271_17490 [Gemmatimonadetes bacterium]|nr:hypothetical protein [Gemmatimonadota bacterium]